METTPHEENQYIQLVKKCLTVGDDTLDRTGTGTYSNFGETMRYTLKDWTIPLLTTKRVFWKGVVEELLWFISGSTDSKKLSEKGVKIWDLNGSKENLKSLGFGDRREGDLGPVYGFQWRHFGADYRGVDFDHSGLGVDQLANCIDMIRSRDPKDARRIIMTSWNPKDIPLMALPPCHMTYQFSVRQDKYLDCKMDQRSADLGLGVPFNMASTSLLTCLIAHITNLEPGQFFHTLGDTHIYKNHVEPIKEHFNRTPRQFPKIKINCPRNFQIDQIKSEHIELDGYDPWPTIKMDMSK